MRDDRTLFNLDPENKYPSDGPRFVEINANKILVMLMELNMEQIRNFAQIDFSGQKTNEVSALLPGSTMERTRDCIQIDFGGEEGIVILITPEAIELRLPSIEWVSPHWPAGSSKFWKKVEVNNVTDGELDTLLREALDERQKQFKKCRFCKRHLPPEHMHDDVCHECAEKYLGVVH